MLKINLNSPTPIYEQLVNEIVRMINTGELKEGDSLPPIRALAKQLDVDKNTVARAYQDLYSREIIEGNRRKGSFVRKSAGNEAISAKKIFKEPIVQLLQLGYNKNRVSSRLS